MAWYWERFHFGLLILESMPYISGVAITHSNFGRCGNALESTFLGMHRRRLAGAPNELTFAMKDLDYNRRSCDWTHKGRINSQSARCEREVWLTWIGTNHQTNNDSAMCQGQPIKLNGWATIVKKQKKTKIGIKISYKNLPRKQRVSTERQTTVKRILGQ